MLDANINDRSFEPIQSLALLLNCQSYRTHNYFAFVILSGNQNHNKRHQLVKLSDMFTILLTIDNSSKQGEKKKRKKEKSSQESVLLLSKSYVAWTWLHIKELGLGTNPHQLPSMRVDPT